LPLSLELDKHLTCIKGKPPVPPKSVIWKATLFGCKMKIKGKYWFFSLTYNSTWKLGSSISMTLGELVAHLWGRSGAYPALSLIVTNTKIRLGTQYSVLVLGTRIFIPNINVLQEQATMFHSFKNFQTSKLYFMLPPFLRIVYTLFNQQNCSSVDCLDAMYIIKCSH